MSRQYVVSLPTVVTIHEKDFVTLDVDLSELSELDPELALNEEEITEEQLKTDSALLARWGAIYCVQGEGYVS